MMKWAVPWLGPLIVATVTSAASAQALVPGDIDGRDLASKLCSNCHAVDPAGAETARADVPSFRSIANSPRTTPERLAAAIILPHPAMPGVPLTRAEIQAIILYVMSLKKEP